MMRYLSTRSAVLSLLLAGASAAPVAAQYGWGGYGGYGYGFASTAAEGYARGMADVVRSAGAYNLMSSAAAINLEQARSAYLDNQLKYTETYYAKKRMHQSYVDSTRSLGMSSERLASLAKSTPPAPLTEKELDPVSGNIAWPRVLRDDPYESLRQKLDGLFAQRADAGGNISYKHADEIVAVSNELSAELKKRLKDYPSGDYMSAKRFIERLSREAAAL